MGTKGWVDACLFLVMAQSQYVSLIVAPPGSRTGRFLSLLLLPATFQPLFFPGFHALLLFHDSQLDSGVIAST